MKKLLLSAVLSVAACAVAVEAATIAKTAKFHVGDNIEWCATDFDDSDWPEFSIVRTWDDQGVKNNHGFGWYRLKFFLDKSILDLSDIKEEIVLNLGCIDDADETYLNGELVGKTGSLPSGDSDFASAWDHPRNYRIKVDDPRLKWGEENVLAVRCFNGGEPGGWFRGGFGISVPSSFDNLKITANQSIEGNDSFTDIILNNECGKTQKGRMTIKIVDPITDEATTIFDRNISVRSHAKYTVPVKTDADKQSEIRATFNCSDGKTVKSLTMSPKYILTPKAPAAPRYNGATVYGLRPGSPMHWRLPISGVRPMVYTAKGLPEGLQLDKETGILSGNVKQAGDYKITFTARNREGEVSQDFTLKVGNTIALTPPMGWNSWNCWGMSVSEEKVLQSANAIIEKGLADYGYSYINIDDNWEAAERNPDGTIAVNAKFPDMKKLGDKLHEAGLKFGIYSSPGDLTCGGCLGSLGHEKQDAESYNSWGIDYLKYDWCGYGREFDRLGDTTVAGYVRPYIHMEQYLREQPRDIFYSLCQYGMADVWKWGHAVDANSWRTTGDIVDTWESLYDIGFVRQAGLSPYAGPGHWNDPDMLIVGKVGWSDKLRDSRLTPDEQYTHITLWSLLASNMLIGCNVDEMDDFTINLLCNHEVNQVNQDSLGHQADLMLNKDGIQVWGRPLADGSRAYGIFNLNDERRPVDVASLLKEVGENHLINVRDLWRQTDLSPESLNTKITSHGCLMLKVK